MEVVVKIAAEGAPSKSLAAIRRKVKAMRMKNLTVEPLHPHSADADLATYYRVFAPDALSAARIIEALQGLPSVVSAYAKPPDAPP